MQRSGRISEKLSYLHFDDFPKHDFVHFNHYLYLFFSQLRVPKISKIFKTFFQRNMCINMNTTTDDTKTAILQLLFSSMDLKKRCGS